MKMMNIKFVKSKVNTGSFNEENDKNIPKALELCTHGRALPIDIGQFGNRYFTYVAAFGAFTDVSYETPQPRKNMLGGLAYLLEGLLRLPNIQSYK